MESKIELIFNTFLVGLVQEVAKESGLDEEKVKTIIEKVSGSVNINIPPKKTKEEKKWIDADLNRVNLSFRKNSYHNLIIES